MLRKKICDILHKVQQSSSCHQKYRHVLIKLFDESPFDDFESEFMRCVERIFGVDVKGKNVHIERCMEFFTTFVTTLAKNQDNNSSDDDEFEIHPFLNAVIYNVLEYHKLEQVSVRFRSCQFINLILRHLGDDAHIDADIANAIQVAMTERLQDTKTSVRLQAVKALVRLQIPEDANCPVMASLMSRLYESSPKVRREIVESIAVVPTFIPRIIERVRDTDYNVRLAAYKKCSLIGPKLITIANRRLIINSGFTEENQIVKRAFLEDTLPKWLNIYNGDYILLLKALKYDAYEEDLQETESISKQVLEVYFKLQSLDTFFEYLPLDDDKVIPVEKLSTELALFWSILVNFFRKSDNDEYLVKVIPEMTPFCGYIEKVYDESKKKNCVNWRYLEFQQILCQLLKIARDFDYSDELGRRTMQKLLHSFLLDGKFSSFVLTEVVLILVQINPFFDSLTVDICHIISDIHAPLVDQPPSADKLRENNFKLAELRVKINILLDERDTAVAEADYEKAAKVKKQLVECNREVENLTVTEAPTQVKTVQDDSETLCRCLNILIAVLSHPKLSSLTASLRSCKDEFVMPLLNHSDLEVFSKAFKSVALYCLLDEEMIREHLKLICSPIIAYRLMPQYDKASLLVSIAAFSDSLRVFGTDIFTQPDGLLNQNTTKRRLNGTRRLYTTTQLDSTDNVDFDTLNCEEILFILVDMLDDESQELRECAGRGLCELVKSRIIVSPTIISRLILKWFNPATERCDQKLQQLLSNAIVFFAQYVKDSEEILEKAVIPILTSLGNAPATSPLSDVNTDNAIEFLSAITFIEKSTVFHNVHKNLAFALCYKIAARPEDRCVPLYIKMLLSLELSLEDDPLPLNELINQSQLIIEEVTDKNMKRNLLKFVSRLMQLRDRLKGESTEETPRTSLANVSGVTPTRFSTENAQVSKTPNINRTTQNVVTPGLGNNPEDSINDTILRTIIEDSEPVTHNDSLQSNKSYDSTTSKKSTRLSLKPQASERKNKRENLPTTSNQTVKRRKRRGRISVVANDSQENESFQNDNLNIESPLSSPSHNSSGDSAEAQKRVSRRVIVSETSSDSEGKGNKAVRRSSRKKQRTRPL